MFRTFSDNQKPIFKPQPYRKQNNNLPSTINFNKIGAQPNVLALNTNRPGTPRGEKDSMQMVSCWKFQWPHYTRDCPNKTNGVLHNLQEDPTIEEMDSTPRIYAALDGR